VQKGSELEVTELLTIDAELGGDCHGQARNRGRVVSRVAVLAREPLGELGQAAADLPGGSLELVQLLDDGNHRTPPFEG
jgi:hypothetical protein